MSMTARDISRYGPNGPEDQEDQHCMDDQEDQLPPEFAEIVLGSAQDETYLHVRKMHSMPQEELLTVCPSVPLKLQATEIDLICLLTITITATVTLTLNLRLLDLRRGSI